MSRGSTVLATLFVLTISRVVFGTLLHLSLNLFPMLRICPVFFLLAEHYLIPAGCL